MAERKQIGTRPLQPRTPVTLRSAVRWTLFSLLAWLLIDSALFRPEWYLQYLEPNSTAGRVELALHWLTRRPPSARPEVMVVGDSRVAEGFSSRRAAEAVQNRLRFWNMGIGGTSPRIWYYLIRDADPTRRRFAALVLPLDHFSDEDGDEDLSERFSDLNYVIGRLRITDCPGFARSMDIPKLQLQVLTGCLFKGATLRPDVKDLLVHFSARMKSAGDWRENGAGYIDGYEGKPEDVIGISADWAKHRVIFPAGLNEIQRNTIQSTVMPHQAPQTGALSRYRRQWFGRILDLYRNSPTRIIFIEMPRAPIPRPESGVPARFIDSVKSRSGVRVLPADTFRDLEKPELFADGLHLNHNGRPLFSQRLAAKVSDILGGR